MRALCVPCLGVEINNALLRESLTRETILRSISVRMGMCRPNMFLCMVNLRLSWVASHYVAVPFL